MCLVICRWRFKTDTLLVPAYAMKNLVTPSPYCSSPHDCRALVKTALICRREIASYRIDNNHKFTVEEQGFNVQYQETSVPYGLKFLVGMITRRPSAEETVTETQAALSIAQLVFFNRAYYTESDKFQSHRDTLTVYIELCVHSRFRSGEMVDELY